jgi:transcriptional regulator with XRE-family HTH domain
MAPPRQFHAMRSHLSILAQLLKEQGLTQTQVAARLGYKSGSAVGMMLRGERGMGREELEKMCELAGITVAILAAQSDDLVLTKRPEAVEAATIIDDASPEELAALMPLLRAYRKSKSDR